MSAGCFRAKPAWVLVWIPAILMMGISSLMAQQAPSILGRWQYRDNQQETITDFMADGRFHQSVKTNLGQHEVQGRYTWNAQLLQMAPDGYLQGQQIRYRFQDANTLILTYETGQSITVKRLAAGNPSAATAANLPAAVPPPATSATAKTGAVAKKPAQVFLQRGWEPNEKAFSILVPKGWKIDGGIFNVNPLQTNGPGNSISPKCDFSVKNDDKGTVMIRWMPGWNYADLTYAPSGFGLFQPGQFYKGMPVRVKVNARQYLTEMLRKERPQASGLKVIAEDSMGEVTRAFESRAEGVNRQLQNIGVGSIGFESLALWVEYTEGGTLFREVLMTTIADNRKGAFQWSNENTLMFRAPDGEFESWKTVLDLIRASRSPNPQWLAAVEKAGGERAKLAWETQNYISQVANEIVANRQKANAEIRYERYLFLSGQEEYKNPFTGEKEVGSSAYRYRWQNRQDEILYTDRNEFDPNQIKDFEATEWKRTEAWNRK
jgi:hypothetical protein